MDSVLFISLQVVEQMQEVGLLDQSQRKETELEVLKWMEHSRNFQTQAEALNKEITELKQVRLRNQDTVNRFESFFFFIA